MTTVERQEKWEPVEGIVTPAARAVLTEDHEGLVVTMMFSEIADGLQSDLRMNFGRVFAYTVYEEFVHPWDTVEAAPRLALRWERYIYPLLQIKNSKWMSSLANFLFLHPESIHYRLLTLDQIVDVLCNKPPEVTWVSGVQS
jgi:hypothetical protein